MGAANLTTSTPAPSLGSYTGTSSPPPALSGELARVRGDAGVQGNGVSDGRRVPDWQGEQFRLLDVARRLFPEDDRLQRCHRVRVSRAHPVTMHQRESGRLLFENVQTCGRLACPVCGARIRVRRAQETKRLAAAAADLDYAVLRSDWTYQHGAGDDLRALLRLQDEAFRKLGSGKNAVSQRVRRVGGEFRGMRRADDYTFGQSGHHPHVHSVLFVRGASVADVEGTLQDAWGNATAAVGLRVGRNALQVQEIDPSGAGYLFKPGNRTGKPVGGRYSAAQLLQEAAQGNVQAGQLWADYARATMGRTSTVTTPGLRNLVLERASLSDGQDAQLSTYRKPDGAVLVADFGDWHGVNAAVLASVAEKLA